MKTLKLFFLLFALTGTTVVVTSCDDDDDGDMASCTDGIMNGNETGVDCGGPDCAACPTCDDGVMNGDETGVDCGGPDCPACLVGLQGEWQSSGANVAPLLVQLFDTDSIYANFRTDNTYVVHQFDSQGSMLELTGVYTQMMSGVDDIWTIEVNQTTPAALTSEGIFEIDGNTMMYEIVQTEPNIGAVPPTPQAGFGSTNGGALGTANVQTYVRID